MRCGAPLDRRGRLLRLLLFTPTARQMAGLCRSGDRVTPTIVEQVWDTRRLRMQHLVLAHGTHHTVIVADPRRVRHIVDVRYVMALGRLFAVVVHNRKQLVLLLLRLVLLRGEDLWGAKRGRSQN